MRLEELMDEFALYLVRSLLALSFWDGAVHLQLVLIAVTVVEHFEAIVPPL